MNNTFWQRCHDADCAVVPVMVHSIDHHLLISGWQLKYVCANIVADVYLTDVRFRLIDDKAPALADTPEQALRDYISRNDR